MVDLRRQFELGRQRGDRFTQLRDVGLLDSSESLERREHERGQPPGRDLHQPTARRVHGEQVGVGRGPGAQAGPDAGELFRARFTCTRFELVKDAEGVRFEAEGNRITLRARRIDQLDPAKKMAGSNSAITL